MNPESSTLSPSPRVPAAFGLGSVLLVVAALGAAYLAISHTSALPGCGESCDELRTGRFSSILGLPVAALGALTYLVAALFRARPVLWKASSVAIVLAALWFTGVQMAAGQYCPWCLALHATALLGLALSARSAVNPAPAGARWLAPAMALAGVAAVASVQTFGPAPQAKSLSAPIAAAQTGGVLKVHDGKFTLVAKDWPMIGEPSAKTLAAIMYDYTCGHCYELKKQAAEAVEKDKGALGVIRIPAFRNDQSRELQRLMMTVFNDDLARFTEFEEKLGTDKMMSAPNILREAIAKAYGGDDAFKAIELKHSGTVERALKLSDELLTANEKLAGSRNLPQFIAGNYVFVGSRPNVDQFIAEAKGTALPPGPSSEKGLEFETPEVNFGKNPGGTLTNFMVKVTNNGTVPQDMKGVVLPDGWMISKPLPAKFAVGATETMTVRWRFPLKTGEWKEEIKLVGGPNAGKLTIKADLWEPYTLSTPQIDLVLNEKNEPAKMPETLTITLKEPGKLELQEIPCAMKPSLKAIGDDGLKFEITFTPDPGKPPLPNGLHFFLTCRSATTENAPPIALALPVKIKVPTPPITASAKKA
jgi:uncharacterized membrane protein